MLEKVLELVLEYKEYFIVFGLLVVTQIFKLFTPIIKRAISNIKNKKFKNTLEKNSFVQQLLDELRIDLKADRTFICQFHNGTKFVNETMHTYFYSSTYESSSIGLTSIEINRRPISGAISSITKLLLENRIIVEDINDVENLHFKYFYSNYGIESFIIHKIVNQAQEVVGFVCVSWNCVKKITIEELDVLSNFIIVLKDF